MFLSGQWAAVPVSALVPPPPAEAFDLAMADGAVIRVHRHGVPGGLRVVLSHGNGFASDAYFPFWRLLAERCEVVLFDFRNYGRNPFHGPEGHDFAHFVDDLGRVHRGIEARLGKRTTVGAFHSMSARTALRSALDGAWPWDALVLFDPPMVPPPGHPLRPAMEAEGRRLAHWAEGRAERFADPDELAALYRRAHRFRRWPPGAAELVARATLRRDEGAGGWRLSCPGPMEAAVYLENNVLDIWPARAELARPLILITCDPAEPEARSRAPVMAALEAECGLRRVVIPDTGHFLEIERPEACLAAMRAFLAENGIVL